MTVFEKVALNNRTTREEVKKEIRYAIEMAMKNPNPQIQQIWHTLSANGRIPTGEELTEIIASYILNNYVKY